MGSITHFAQYFRVPQGSEATGEKGRMERSGPPLKALSGWPALVQTQEGFLALRGLLSLPPSPLTEQQPLAFQFSPHVKRPLASSLSLPSRQRASSHEGLPHRAHPSARVSLVYCICSSWCL